ncbi:MAG: hypothetical protein QGH20_01010, partial [Candidatus Latescibacteria bacterium]|jgi:transposase-like protein|nr:hypothetical protein [Candidatus Latescibacterota bacterium]|tara:strand:+ start:780 stop:1241 length:462 start_codon:yes stop_codon:yes gene_type:complete
MGRLTQERVQLIIEAAIGGTSEAEIRRDVARVDPSTWRRWRRWAKAGNEPYAQMMEKVAKAVADNEGIEVKVDTPKGVQSKSRLSVLRRENADLYKAVKEGSMKLNAAYGILRGKRVTISSDPELAAKALTRHFSLDDLKVIKEQLTKACSDA